MNYREHNEYSICMKRYLIRGLDQYMIWGKIVVKWELRPYSMPQSEKSLRTLKYHM
jgi:hypothetical protein